ncbi:MAG: hypothetical protein WC586_00305 [Methanoregula sp.]
MISDLVQATLASCDGMMFDSCKVCPNCNGEVAGYDVKKKQFAIIMDRGQKKVIHVLVKRFHCRSCKEICLADQPFYPDTRIGSPVVDLSVTLGETMHFPRVSSCLADMGVVVDRWSVRNYVQKNTKTIPAVDMFGIRIPMSVVSLSSLSMKMNEIRGIDAQEVLAACGYPSRKQNGDGHVSQKQISDPSLMERS